MMNAESSGASTPSPSLSRAVSPSTSPSAPRPVRLESFVTIYETHKNYIDSLKQRYDNAHNQRLALEAVLRERRRSNTVAAAPSSTSPRHADGTTKHRDRDRDSSSKKKELNSGVTIAGIANKRTATATAATPLVAAAASAPSSSGIAVAIPSSLNSNSAVARSSTDAADATLSDFPLTFMRPTTTSAAASEAQGWKQKAAQSEAVVIDLDSDSITPPLQQQQHHPPVGHQDSAVSCTPKDVRDEFHELFLDPVQKQLRRDSSGRSCAVPSFLGSNQHQPNNNSAAASTTLHRKHSRRGHVSNREVAEDRAQRVLQGMGFGANGNHSHQQQQKEQQQQQQQHHRQEKGEDGPERKKRTTERRASARSRTSSPAKHGNQQPASAQPEADDDDDDDERLGPMSDDNPLIKQLRSGNGDSLELFRHKLQQQHGGDTGETQARQRRRKKEDGKEGKEGKERTNNSSTAHPSVQVTRFSLGSDQTNNSNSNNSNAPSHSNSNFAVHVQQFDYKGKGDPHQQKKVGYPITAQLSSTAGSSAHSPVQSLINTDKGNASAVDAESPSNLAQSNTNNDNNKETSQQQQTILSLTQYTKRREADSQNIQQPQQQQGSISSVSSGVRPLADVHDHQSPIRFTPPLHALCDAKTGEGSNQEGESQQHDHHRRGAGNVKLTPAEYWSVKF